MLKFTPGTIVRLTSKFVECTGSTEGECMWVVIQCNCDLCKYNTFHYNFCAVNKLYCGYPIKARHINYNNLEELKCKR
jgi:hypothetical protein